MTASEWLLGAEDQQDRPAILVVDDDPRIRQMIQWTLEDEGFAVETAADGQQALATAAAQRPSLIILDMGLPDIDGGRLGPMLRQVAGVTVPILVITADGHAAEKALRVGAFGYLHKPFDIDELIANVRRGYDSR